MKKLALPLCIILLAALLSAIGGKQATKPDTPQIQSVSEAAFSIRNSECTDATSFLVGKFFGDNGSKLTFTGDGYVTEVKKDYSATTGEYTLTQTENGSAMLLEVRNIEGEVKLYSFHLASPDGDFILMDADGVAVTYKPIQ